MKNPTSPDEKNTARFASPKDQDPRERETRAQLRPVGSTSWKLEATPRRRAAAGGGGGYRAGEEGRKEERTIEGRDFVSRRRDTGGRGRSARSPTSDFPFPRCLLGVEIMQVQFVGAKLSALRFSLS